MSNFKGFERPTDNYSKLPHSFIDLLPTIDTMAEMKVVIYLLRHTWGFSEFGKPKKLTTDEFANGRKKRDQSRMDAGTGLSENSVRAGLEKAVEHGFIIIETNESDKARIEKWYCLNMEGDSESESRPAKIAPLDSEIAPRSEKETTEIKELSTKVLKTDEVKGKYKTKATLPAGSGLDWQIATGASSAEIAASQDVSAHEQAVANFYESALGYNPLPWWTDKDLARLLRFLLDKPAEEVTAFAEWSKRKFSTFDPAKARMSPLKVIEFWPLAQPTTLSPSNTPDARETDLAKFMRGES